RRQQRIQQDLGSGGDEAHARIFRRTRQKCHNRAMSDSMLVFDRALVRRRRDRAAAGFSAADFIFKESAARLGDRMLDIARTFPRAIELGCHTGALGALLRNDPKVEWLAQADLSPAMTRAARQCNGLATLCCDEEWLPVAEGSLDLVLSNLSLHWVND